MHNFDNKAYSDLVVDLLNDALYIDGRSNRGVISTIRQYAEVIVRRILDLPTNKRMMLGDEAVKSELKSASGGNESLSLAIEKIRSMGNKCTHTQELDPITDCEVKQTFDALFDMYAYLFVDFFTKHTFGHHEEIVLAFSILPPIIRYKALKELNHLDPHNISVIDKYSLSILKAFDLAQAKKWVEEQKESLIEIPAFTEKGIEEIEKNHGAAVARDVMNNAPNMFDCCMDRLTEVASILENNGLLYNDFESAMDLFKRKGRIHESSIEADEFNSLMEFCYLGRKPKPNDKLDAISKYLSFI